MTAEIADELLAAVLHAEPGLRGLPGSVTTVRPAPDRWTIREVLGHLIDSAANNHQRFVRAQWTAPLVFPRYEQNEWVTCQNYEQSDWTGLIDLWVAYNRHLAHVIRNARKEALDVSCRIGDYPPVTLRFLMQDYVVHMRHHLQKIAERVAATPSG